MASRHFILARLALKERLAIKLLRGAVPQDFTSDDRQAFDRLLGATGEARLLLAPLTSPYVTADEMRLLGWFAALQRQRPPAELDIPAALRVHIADCASRLADRYMRLDVRLIDLLPEMADRPLVPSGGMAPAQSGTLPKTGLQAKALRYVHEHGKASTVELDRLGISRQVISLMFKRGLLMRVRTGVYAVAPGALASAGP